MYVNVKKDVCCYNRIQYVTRKCSEMEVQHQNGIPPTIPKDPIG